MDDVLIDILDRVVSVLRAKGDIIIEGEILPLGRSLVYAASLSRTTIISSIRFLDSKPNTQQAAERVVHHR